MSHEHLDRHRAALAELLGPALVVEPSVLETLRADKSGHLSGAPPLALVEARSIEDVQATLRYANEHGIPVVPRGAGTGLAGGAIGGAGELVLSTRAMQRVLELSAADELVVVEPGILNGDLNDQLAAHGLWFAPDPASRAISTIGGNIATNAGGLSCVKYGVTREAVLGLAVVLADGRLLRTGHRTVKGVTGLDLAALMVGSEGTLGVIVEATLRVRPRPQGTADTVSVSFASTRDAARAASAMMAAGMQPSALEILDAAALRAIGDYLNQDLSDRGAQLLIRTDGEGAAEAAQRALELAAELGGRGELAVSVEAGEELFAMRRAFHGAMAARGEVLIEDVAVPRSALADMFDELERIGAQFDVDIATVAHAGDGNLHPNFTFESQGFDAAGEPIVPEEVWAAADAMFTAALRLGGTLTGEHGVGLLKRRWLRTEIGDVSFELQREIKRVFDPRGILNPGKVY